MNIQSVKKNCSIIIFFLLFLMIFQVSAAERSSVPEWIRDQEEKFLRKTVYLPSYRSEKTLLKVIYILMTAVVLLMIACAWLMVLLFRYRSLVKTMKKKKPGKKKRRKRTKKKK